ncbi:hypothetical protein [Methanoplanus limicola]|nr:hypothetical protein [Methanoplanus limicola]
MDIKKDIRLTFHLPDVRINGDMNFGNGTVSDLIYKGIISIPNIGI